MPHRDLPAPSAAAAGHESDDDQPGSDEKVPRILAYSDSEDEDEMRERKRQEKADQEEVVEEALVAETQRAAGGDPGGSGNGGGGGGSNPAVALVQLAGAVAQQLLGWLGPKDVALAGALAVANRSSPRMLNALELCSLLAALPVAASGLTHRMIPLPGPVQGPVASLAGLLRAVVLRRVFHAAAGCRRRRKLRRVTSSTTEEVLARAALEREPLQLSASYKPPSTLNDYCALYAAEMQELKRILLHKGAALPVERFDRSNRELMRYAMSSGLLRAKSPEDSRLAISEAAMRVISTLSWSKWQRFMTRQELQRWEPLVRWCRDTPAGRSVLLVRFGRALQHCHGKAIQRFVDAIISTMQLGTVAQVRSKRLLQDQIIVTVDCRGANSLTLAQHMGLVKSLGHVLNLHYPHRLHRIFLVEVPQLLRWALAMVLPVLHSDTRSKVRVVPMDSRELPIRLAGPDLRRLSAGSGSGAFSVPFSPAGSFSLPSAPAHQRRSAEQQMLLQQRASSPAAAPAGGAATLGGGAGAAGGGGGGGRAFGMNTTPLSSLPEEPCGPVSVFASLAPATTTASPRAEQQQQQVPSRGPRPRQRQVSFVPGLFSPAEAVAEGSGERTPTEGGSDGGGRMPDFKRAMSAECNMVLGSRKQAALGVARDLERDFKFDVHVTQGGGQGQAGQGRQLQLRPSLDRKRASKPAVQQHKGEHEGEEELTGTMRLAMTALFFMFIALAATMRNCMGVVPPSPLLDIM